MSRQEVKPPLKNSLISITDDFFHVVQLDVVINFKRIIRAFVFSLMALLFGFLIWVYFIYNLYNYLVAQGFTHESILFITFAINAFMLVIFWILSHKQLSKIRFLYSNYAIRKIIRTLGGKNESL